MNTPRMPWSEAVAMLGEDVLKQTHSHQRVSNWRRDGVPGAVLLPLLLAHIRYLNGNPLDWWSR